MTTKALSGFSILIVKHAVHAGCDLRSAFQELAAHVHVVSSVDAGCILARRKRLHGAIVDRRCIDACWPLCVELARRQVPYIFHDGSVAANAIDDMMRLIAQASPAADLVEA